MDDNEEQDNEILALQAIFDEDIFIIDEKPVNDCKCGKFLCSPELPGENFTVEFKALKPGKI